MFNGNCGWAFCGHRENFDRLRRPRADGTRAHRHRYRVCLCACVCVIWFEGTNFHLSRGCRLLFATHPVNSEAVCSVVINRIPLLLPPTPLTHPHKLLHMHTCTHAHTHTCTHAHMLTRTHAHTGGSCRPPLPDILPPRHRYVPARGAYQVRYLINSLPRNVPVGLTHVFRMLIGATETLRGPWYVASISVHSVLLLDNSCCLPHNTNAPPQHRFAVDGGDRGRRSR